jgi:DNA-binding CsgD family transcriptional regulator
MGFQPPERLVGRQWELARAHGLVEGLSRGAGATLLIEGEAGIGKSLLVQKVIGLAGDAGVAVYRGDAHPFEGTRPFGPIAQALDLRAGSSDPRRASIGRLLAGGGANVEANESAPFADARHQVVEEIIDIVETVCARAPAVMVIEDLHWADESTLLAFRSMARVLGHVPLLLVGSMRLSPRSTALDQLVDEALQSDGQLLRLESLTPGDVDALVHSELGLPPGALLTSIVAKAGGNPLWVVEIVRSLSTEGWLRRGPAVAEAIADEIPGSLRELVLRRLRYLPAEVLNLLRIAAVLGDAVSVYDVAAVARRPAAEVVRQLDEAFRAGLLDEHADALVFRHQLVHDAIYQDLPQPLRRALHRDAAGVLAHLNAGPLRVAGHLIRGAEPGDLEAVRWLRQASTEAITTAPSVAVELQRQASTLLPAGHEDVDLVVAELVEALQRAGEVAEASDVAEAVLSRAHRADVDVRLRLALVSALSLQNRGSELIHHAEAALVRFPGMKLADQALVLAQASYGRTFSGEFVGGEATARQALALAERAASTAMTVWSLTAMSVAVKTQGRYAEALELTQRAVALAFDPLDNDARLRHPHFFHAMALSDSDLIEEARGAYRIAIREYEELGSSWLLPDTLLLSAELRFLVGEWDDAATELQSGLHLAREHGQRISVAQSRAYEALMATAKGNDRGARAALMGLERELASDVPCYGAELVAFAYSTLAEARGEASEAFEMLLRFWEHDSDRDVRYYHRYLGPPLVRLGLTLDQRDVSSRVAAEVEEGAALAPEVPTVQSAALRCRGLVDEDPEKLVEAVELARRGPRLLDHAGACEDAAAVLTATGQSAKATELLTEAHARYEAVDARAWASRTGAELRRLGVRQGIRGQRRRLTSGWESLTSSELAVCQFVAEGLTNRDIGRRLYISPHTVNTHLRHVFQKLSVSTRAELAGLVALRSALR